MNCLEGSLLTLLLEIKSVAIIQAIAEVARFQLGETDSLSAANGIEQLHRLCQCERYLFLLIQQLSFSDPLLPSQDAIPSTEGMSPSPMLTLDSPWVHLLLSIQTVIKLSPVTVDTEVSFSGSTGFASC